MAPSQWQKLIEYYRACISVENTAEVKFLRRNNGKDFFHVTQEECISSGSDTLEIDERNPSFRSFIDGARWNKAPSTYLYGFPCYDKDQSIHPLFIFDVELTQGQAANTFVLQPNQPRINTSGLGYLRPEEQREAAKALDESWDEDKAAIDNVETTLQRLEAIFPSFNRNTLLHNPSGVLFRSIDSAYTQGLQQELGQLASNFSPNEVCEIILDRTGEPIEESDYGILEITRLNDEQRGAIRSAFVNPLTVVTGPPGTGKSQVILNVITNALLRNETVLFGSRNNQAVDVVIERLSRIQSQPLILRYENQRYGNPSTQFAETLQQAVERASTLSSDVLGNEIRNLKDRLAQLYKEKRDANQALSRILDRRNRIQEIEISLEAIVAELPYAISAELSVYEKFVVSESYRPKIASLARLIEEAEHPNILTLMYLLFGRPIGKRLMRDAQSLLATMPDYCMNLATESLDDCREVLVIAKTLAKWIDLQNELLRLIDQNWNEPRIEILRTRIVNSQEHAVEASIQYVDALMKRRLKNLTAGQRRAVGDYASHLRALQNNFTGEDLRREISKASEKAFRDGVARAFPAIAVTNLSVRRAVPLMRDVVDLVVIDEASQCDIASALPLLYRGKRALVIGDPNQLSHIAHLHPADDRRVLTNAGLSPIDDLRFQYPNNSVFDLVRTTVGSGSRFVHLLDHYRSREEIIGFSNKEFYGGFLNVHTDYRELSSNDSAQPVTWHDVKGETVRPPNGSAYNLVEAQEVVALVQSIVKRTANRQQQHISLGVVTPFREQANMIQRMVKENGIDTARLKQLNFMVGTAHHYQGDERDIMIFSPVISRKAPESSLGFIRSTRNLFNVAITRARAELHTVGDMSTCANSNTGYLSNFVKYVQELEHDLPFDDASGLFESPWEQVFFNALKDAGISSYPQYRFHQYKLDLAIPDKMIDIEIDGEYYHQNLDGSRVHSDLKRDTHLTTRGWRVKRFWVYELQSNLGRCVWEIKGMLTS